MPQSLTNRATGQAELVEDADIPAALASKKYVDPQAVAVNRFGEDTYATPDIANREADVTKTIAPEQAALAKGHAIREKANTGIIAGAKAFAGGAISGVTMGMANPFESEQEFNGLASGAGQLAGAFVPGMFGDEAGIAGAIAKDGVSTEHLAGSLSSKYLYAGELGEGAHAGAGFERGLAKAGEHLESIQKASQLPEDLAGLDAAGLRTAKEGELDQLASAHTTQRATAKSAAVDDALAYQNQIKEANPYLVTGEGPSSKAFYDSSKSINKAMKDVEGLRESPNYLLKPLRQQAQALEETLAERESIAGKLESANTKIAKDLGEDLATLPDAATHVELSGKAARRYASYADVKLSAKTATLSVAREDAQAFVEAIESGEVTGAGQEALGKLPDMLEANRGLQAKIKAASAKELGRAELTSPRLTAINAAHDVLSTPTSRSMAEDMLGGSIQNHVAHAFSALPIIGPMLGAKAGKLATDLVFGRMGKTVAAAGERTSNAIKSFLTIAKRSTPTLPVLASKTLASVAYGPAEPSASSKGAKTSSIVGPFKQRIAEIKAQTAYGPDGEPQMRPDARAAMSARLAPIRAASPVLADKIETLGAKRIEYLSSIIPRRPDIGGMQIGPDHWQPSDLQMRSFARSMAAVEDPHGVEERIAHGQVTPEDAAAYHAVYPDRAEALKQQLLMELPKLQKTLPYARRLSLSIFAGVAVDPSLDPRVLHALQAQYIAEEGTDGGTDAPKPKPAFGSVKADPGTLSQQREGQIG